jgi:hypothetical protein
VRTDSLNHLKLLWEALTLGTVLATFNSEGEIEMNVQDSVHRLISLVPDEAMQRVTLKIASDFILDQIKRILCHAGAHKLAVLARGAWSAWQMDMYGNYYECFCHNVISQLLANNFQIREYFPDGTQSTLISLSLGKWERRGIINFNVRAFFSLVLRRGCYFTPRSGNCFPCIDSCARTRYGLVSESGNLTEHAGLIGFQMTVSNEHELTTGRRNRVYGTVFEQFLAKREAGEDMPLFVFVVPVEGFDSFVPTFPPGFKDFDKIKIIIMKLPLELNLPAVSAPLMSDSKYVLDPSESNLGMTLKKFFSTVAFKLSGWKIR